MIIEASCGCNKGRIRSNNEDNFYFNGYFMDKDNDGLSSIKTSKTDSSLKPLFCVFDGMGGEEAGELASHLAAKYTKEYLSNHGGDLVSANASIEDWCFYMSNNIFEASRDISYGNVGTTMVSAYFAGKDVYISNIGDSRAFLIRGNEMKQLSEDHVEKLPPSMMKHKPRLTQNLGVDPTELMIEPWVVKHTPKKDDVYLLCSDGLTDMVSEEDIRRTVKSHASTTKAVEKLISQALSHGGKDNITVLICKVR